MKLRGVPIESLYTLAVAAAKVPGRRPGKKVSISTLERWRRKGLKGVVLETVPCGGQTCTCDAWLQAFLDAAAAKSGNRQASSAQPRSPDRRGRESARAGERLAERMRRRPAAV